MDLEKYYDKLTKTIEKSKKNIPQVEKSLEVVYQRSYEENFTETLEIRCRPTSETISIIKTYLPMFLFHNTEIIYSSPLDEAAKTFQKSKPKLLKKL